jgi:hypothetical protein
MEQSLQTTSKPVKTPKAYPYISSALISSIWPEGQYLFQKVKSDEQTKGVEIGPTN